VLCGDKEVIDKLPHLIKIHGGNVFGNWLNGAMALHRLQGFEQRLQEAIKRSKEIFAALNSLPGIKISALDGGTNIYKFEIADNIDGKKMQERLNTEFNIRIGRPNANNPIQLTVNETLLYRDASYVINAFKKAVS